MFTLPTGFFLMMVVLLYVLLDVDPSIFINSHSFTLVVVGSFAVLLLTTPWLDVKSVQRGFFSLFRKSMSNDDMYKFVILLSKNREDKSVENEHQLFKYAQYLWRMGVDRELFETMLHQRSEEMNRIYETGVAVLRNLAKYPPALGMTGTVMGLVSVFSKIAEEGKTNVGPALAIALTATFYGLLLANAILMPLADRLQVARLRSVRQNEAILQLLVLVNRGNPIEQLRGSTNGSSKNQLKETGKSV